MASADRVALNTQASINGSKAEREVTRTAEPEIGSTESADRVDVVRL